MNKKIALFLTFIILLSTIQVTQSYIPWINGWNYRKAHVINQLAGGSTNWIINITVHYSNGLDTERDVYLAGHCLTIFADIRFTESDGISFLSYWIEIKVDSNYALCWVKLTDDISAGNITIYIYYGNQLASSASSIADTFVRVIDGAQPTVLALPIDEGTGTTTYDKSGNGNNGTINGATWVDGKYGKALGFDGVDGKYVEIDDAPSLDLTDEISISLWLKPSITWTSGAWYTIIDKILVDTGYELIWHSSSYFYTYFDNGICITSSVLTLVAGTWYHIAITYKAGTTDGKIYINNVDQTQSCTSQTLTANTAKLRIGALLGIGAYSVNGVIDEVRIYNRALTQAEITDSYNYYSYSTLNLAGEVLVGNMSPAPSQGAWGDEETILQKGSGLELVIVSVFGFIAICAFLLIEFFRRR